jgi:hypothetical protein
LLAAVALGAVACAPAASNVTPNITAAASVNQIDAIASAMMARDRTLVAFRTAAVMEYRDAHQHIKAHETIVARRPSDLRVEIHAPFGMALIIAATGQRLEILEPGNNLLMYGAATAATLDRFARIPMEPRAAVGLLMGIAPDPAQLAGATSAAARGGMILLNYRTGGGAACETGFIGGHLAMVRALSAGGAVDYEVRYSDYHDIGGVQFPYTVEASFPAAGSSLKFAYQRPIVNEAVADSLFTVVPSATTREIDLDQQPAAPVPPRG